MYVERLVEDESSSSTRGDEGIVTAARPLRSFTVPRGSPGLWLISFGPGGAVISELAGVIVLLRFSRA